MAVPSDRDWREVAAENRERIRALEHELERVRDRIHDLAGEVAVIRYLAEQVKDLGEDVKELTGQVRVVATQALVTTERKIERPTLAVIGQYLALAVAVAAIILAAVR